MALEGLGWLLQLQGDHERAKATYEEMLRLYRESGDKGNIATALNSLGTLATYQGDHERVRALLEENLSVLRELEKEGNGATTLKRFHVLNLLGEPGDQPGRRLRSGSNALGGKPGVGPGNRGHLSHRDNACQPRARGPDAGRLRTGESALRGGSRIRP
jgi:tetratricopeptide (TPR) repeat protein